MGDYVTTRYINLKITNDKVSKSDTIGDELENV